MAIVKEAVESPYDGADLSISPACPLCGAEFVIKNDVAVPSCGHVMMNRSNGDVKES